MNCLHCNNYFTDGKGVGTNGAYCKIECWFQSTAAEYQKAYDALTAIEHPATDADDVLARIGAEILEDCPEIECWLEADTQYPHGPWVVDRSYDRRVGTTIRGGTMRPGAANLPAIAKMIDTSIYAATLVGAAPDLLKACEKAQETMLRAGNELGWSHVALRNFAKVGNCLRDAIAKARGE